MRNNRNNLKLVATIKNTAIGIVIALVIALSLTRVYAETEKVSKNDLLIIDTNDHTSEEIWNLIENRNGKLVIVIEHGIVENSDGDGNGNLGYIKYHGCEPGTKVKSYLIYNPDTNYWDDIIERFDYMEE